MEMSRKGQKIIMLILTIAFVLTGTNLSFVCTEKAKAADVTPTVSVLGATLRTEGNEAGKQSLRMGIKISGASAARACGIKVRVKNAGKVFTVVSTEQEAYRNLYSKDIDNDSVTYTIVVQNIPAENASTEFEIIGFVKDMKGAVTNTKEETAIDIDTRSVNSVLASIGKSLGHDVMFLPSGDYAGTLVYEYARLDMSDAKSNLQDNSAESYSAGNFVMGKNDKKAESVYNQATDTEEAYYDVTTLLADESSENRRGKGLGYIHANMSPSDSYIYTADMKAEAGLNFNLCAYYGWNTWLQAGFEGKAIAATGDWQSVAFKTSNQESWDSSTYFSIAAPADGAQHSYSIKNVVIYKVVTGDTMPEVFPPTTGFNEDKTEYRLAFNSDTVKADSGISSEQYDFAFNENGTFTFKAINRGYLGFSFYTPAEVLDNYSISNIAIEYTDSNASFTRCFRYVGGSETGDGSGNVGSGSISMAIDTMTEFEYYKFYSGDANFEVTVKSIIYTLTEKPVVTPAPTKDPNKNLATNGDFSDGKTGWSTNYSDNDLTVTDGYGVLTGRWNNYSGVKYVINRRFAQGDVVDFQFDLKLKEDYATNDNLSFVYQFNTASEGSWTKCVTAKGATVYGNATDWTTAEGSYTVTEYTESLTIVIAEGPGWGGTDRAADFYVDNLYISTEAAEPPAATPAPTPVPTYQVVEAYQVNDVITIDGTDSEEAWTNVSWSTISNRGPVNSNYGATTSSARTKIAWDTEYLYGYTEVMDSNISISNENAHEKDGIEFLMDEDRSRETITEGNSWESNSDAFQYRFTGLSEADGVKQNAIHNGFANGNSTYEVDVDYSFIEGGYAVEYKVKFKEIKDINDIVGFDFIVQDCEEGRYSEIYLSKGHSGVEYSYWNLHAPLAIDLKLVASGSEVPIETTLDLSDASNYMFDGTCTGVWNETERVLDTTYGGYTAIIFKAPDDGNTYTSVEVTLSNENTITFYTFDDQLGDGLGSAPAGQHATNVTSPTGTTAQTSYSFEIDDTFSGGKMSAVKLVRQSGSGTTSKISKVTFYGVKKK